jgi:hypothetical protein
MAAGSIVALVAVLTMWGEARLRSSDQLARGEPIRVAVL